MNSPLISIIVPVYNVEPYLRKCLDSILSQTYTNWEALIVDDGSTDKSGSICDEYAKKDNRFKVVHKENGGVSSSRNIGVEKSTGKYVTFVDGDDKLDDQFLEQLIIASERNGGIPAVSGSKRLYDNGISESYVLYNNEILQVDLFLENKLMHTPAWGYLFRSSVIKGHHMEFDNKLAKSEDMLFLSQYFQFESKIVTIDKQLYLYRYNPTSVCNVIPSYEISTNHYHAALRIQKIGENGLLPSMFVNRMFKRQIRQFVESLATINLSKKQYRDASGKLRNLCHKFNKKDLPNHLGLVKISLKFYLSLFRLYRLHRKYFKNK